MFLPFFQARENKRIPRNRSYSLAYFLPLSSPHPLPQSSTSFVNNWVALKNGLVFKRITFTSFKLVQHTLKDGLQVYPFALGLRLSLNNCVSITFRGSRLSLLLYHTFSSFLTVFLSRTFSLHHPQFVHLNSAPSFFHFKSPLYIVSGFFIISLSLLLHRSRVLSLSPSIYIN